MKRNNVNTGYILENEYFDVCVDIAEHGNVTADKNVNCNNEAEYNSSDKKNSKTKHKTRFRNSIRTSGGHKTYN